MQAALLSGLHFQSLYANGARQTTVRAIDLHVQVVPRRMQVTLEAARLISGDSPRAGDTVLVEATLRPWQQPARNIRIPITLPARLVPGNLRLLVSDAGTLDRALDPPRPPPTRLTWLPYLPRTVDSTPQTAFMSASSFPKPRPTWPDKPFKVCHFPSPTPSSPCAPRRRPASTANRPSSKPTHPPVVC